MKTTTLLSILLTLTGNIAGAQTTQVQCSRMPLFSEVFFPCDSQELDQHGGQQLCGSVKTIPQYISEMTASVDKDGAQMEAYFFLEAQNYQTDCSKSSAATNTSYKCEFENGVTVDWYTTGTNNQDHEFVIFASGANSPSYRAQTWFNKECVVQ